MYTKTAIASSALVGILFGELSNYAPILQGAWINLMIWGVVGVLIGLFIIDTRYVKYAGPSYGLFLVASFLVSGFHGNANQLPGFFVLVVAFGVLGALCGWMCVFLGNWVKSIFK